MKKLSRCLLGVMFLFALATPAAAMMSPLADIDSGGDPDLTDLNPAYWTGSDTNPQATLVNSNETTEEAWLEALLGLVYDDPSVNYYDKISTPQGGPQELVNYDPGFDWEYAVVKFGNNWQAFYNDGDRVMSGAFDLGVSHVTFFNGTPGTNTPVPEPATMLLLGTGLVGLVGLGRKKFKK